MYNMKIAKAEPPKLYKSKVGEREYRTLKQTRKMDRQEPWEKEEAKGRGRRRREKEDEGRGGCVWLGPGARSC